MSLDIRRGDIFYIERGGPAVGREQYAGRPGVIISCDANNRHSDTVEVAYCTTQPKTELPTHVEILSTTRPSTVLCEQINTVSVERIGTYIGQCTAEEMRDIDIAIATALGLKKYPGLIERLKEREILVEQRESRVDSTKEAAEAKAKADLSEELAAVKAERDTYQRLYNDLVSRFIPARREPAG